MRLFQLALPALLLASFAASGLYGASGVLVYVGTYTGPNSKGIYAYRFDESTGKLTPVGLAAETQSPSFLALNPKRPVVYAVNELDEFQGQKGGAVSAFAIDKRTGKLRLLNQQPSRGSGPCHVSVDHTGRMVAVANYSSGSMAAYPVRRDGGLGASSAFFQDSGSGTNPKRQEGPHAHSANFSPDNRFLFLADLGLDKVFSYHVDPAKAALTPNDPAFVEIKGGSGPRHMAFRPDGHFAYLASEMASTVTAFSYDAQRGELKTIQTISMLPADFHGESTAAEIEVDKSGRFIYASNRGDDSIAVFSSDPSSGRLTLVEVTPTGGKEPRNFTLDPTGRWLLAANQNSNTITVFSVDQATGRLKATGESVDVASPVCVLFVSKAGR